MMLKDIFRNEDVDGMVTSISQAGHLHSLGYTAFYVDYIGTDSYDNDSHRVRTKWIPTDTIAVVCEKRPVMYSDFPAADLSRIRTDGEMFNIRIQQLYEQSFAILAEVRNLSGNKETVFVQWMPENTVIVIHEAEQ